MKTEKVYIIESYDKDGNNILGSSATAIFTGLKTDKGAINRFNRLYKRYLSSQASKVIVYSIPCRDYIYSQSKYNKICEMRLNNE